MADSIRVGRTGELLVKDTDELKGGEKENKHNQRTNSEQERKLLKNVKILTN